MDYVPKSERRRAKRREIESERLIIEEWLLIPIYMETLDGVRGEEGGRGERTKGPLKFIVEVAFL